MLIASLRASQGFSGKESACNAGDAGDKGLIPQPRSTPGERNDKPFQYSCQENPMDRRAWGWSPRDRNNLDMTETAEQHNM